MNENPYQTPPAESRTDWFEDFSFLNAYRNVRKQKYRWDFNCWVLGSIFVVTGPLLALSTRSVFERSSSNTLPSTLYWLSGILFLSGLLIHVFGPIAWHLTRKTDPLVDHEAD